jgi:dihydrofolate reductase
MEAIYAIDSKGGIGLNGSIPWNSTKDLKFFYQKTKSNIVIIGSLLVKMNISK